MTDKTTAAKSAATNQQKALSDEQLNTVAGGGSVGDALQRGVIRGLERRSPVPIEVGRQIGRSFEKVFTTRW